MSEFKVFHSAASEAVSWQSLIGKLALSAAAFALAGVVFAQAPAPGGPSNAAPAIKDARGYKTLQVNEKMAKDRVLEATVKANVRKVLTAQVPLSDMQRPFDSYYTLFYFPQMTQTDDASLKAMPEERMKFLRYDLEGCRSPEVQAHLTRLTFDEMLAIVRDPEFHPAVRYNALTIIGSLNDKETVRLVNSGAVPEPMARALPVLLDEYRRPENSDALKVAALIGLARHMEWEPHRSQGSAAIPAALRTDVLTEILATAQAKDPPAGRSAEGHVWFRRRAVEALAAASVKKADAPVVAAIEKLLRDDTEPLTLRLTAAAAIGRMKYEPAAKLDVVGIAKELGYLALTACDSELTRVSTLKKTELERAARLAKGVSTFSGTIEGGSSSGGAAIDTAVAGAMPAMDAGAMTGPAGGGSGPLLEDPKAYRFDPVRRRLRYQLYCVQLGLNGGTDKNPTRGIATVAKTPEETKLVNDIVSNVVKLAEVVEVKATEMAQLDKDLRKSMKELEKFAKKAPPPMAPADVPTGDLPALPPAAAAAAADAPAPIAAPAAPPPAADVP